MKRDSYFDNVKGWLIILVVFGHILSLTKEQNLVLNSVYTMIYLFHMPAFVLIAGYFSKKFDPKTYWIKLVKTILIPYVLFQMIYTAFYDWILGSNFDLQFTTPRWTLWFLLSMLGWKILIVYFQKLNPMAGMVCALLVGVLIGFGDTVDERWLSVHRTFYFFPFFYVGYLAQPNHFMLLREKSVKKFSICFGICLPFLAYILRKESFQDYLLGNYYIEQTEDLLIRLFVYVLSAVVIVCFCSLIPRKTGIWTTFGQTSLVIFLWHAMIVKPLGEWGLSRIDSEWYHLFLYFALAWVIAFILSRKWLVNFTNKLSMK